MSWAEEDWTVGLSGRVQQKVKELQIQKERLSRENKQKQLQLDNIHTSLEKQTVKCEEVRGELQSVQRELQSVQEEAQAAVTSKERLNQELHTRQAQICSLEGQLDTSRSQNNTLTQEVKRLEAELEKLQNSGRLADTTLFSTPSWNTTSPWENNGNKQEERSGQQNERQSRSHQARQQLQFSDTPTSLRQHHVATPHRNPSDQSEVFSTPTAVFPWEREDSRPTSLRRLQPSLQMSSPDSMKQVPLEQEAGVKWKDLKTETDAASMLELQHRLAALRDELSEKVGMLKSIQNEVVQTKRELASKELSLQKTQDELTLAHARMSQDRERASETEHRLKQLQDELKCHMQNTESSRLQHQQRVKELEKQHQRDLTELQKERQCLEKQHQQEVNKLNQELQQARTTHNALQAQADKLSLQKQVLDKELDTLKEKLKWTEEQLKESQKKEAQTQAKLTEAVREAEGVAVNLEQSRKRERVLEEEGRRLKEEQADTLRLLRELQEQKTPIQFCPVGQSFSSQSSSVQPPRLQTHQKRPAGSQSGQKREEERVDEGRTEITASYPSDREPGEGIDAEHIANITDSECSQRVGQEGKSNIEGNKRRDEAVKCDVSDASVTSSVDGVTDAEHSPLGQSHVTFSENTLQSEDLKLENAQLRSELSDIREELQRRLEDLEAQRRAETEARTRLKQLSRKHASQAAEREEKDKEWRAKLEKEKAETEGLKRNIATLEAELRRSKEEQDKTERMKEEEEKNKTQEDRESELIELNIQLKNQLAMVRAQLALEREERKQEEEQRNQIINTDTDESNELSMKLAEIMADVKDLKDGKKEVEEEKLSVDNSSLKNLHEDELNSNIVDNKLLPSPEKHLLHCESTNQRNALTSKETIIHLDGQMGKVEDTQQNYQETSSSSGLQGGEISTYDLVKEVELLQKKCTEESERALQYQGKFDALQIQVTHQTEELTLAFEKQTQHIAGLLAELQEKDSALYSQGEELMRCKQELDIMKRERDELGETSGLQPEQEKERVGIFDTTDQLADGILQKEPIQPKMETWDTETLKAETEDGSEAVTSENQQLISMDPKKFQSYDSACEVSANQHILNEGTADILAELLALKQENLLLKQNIKDLNVSDTRNQTLQTESENQEDTEKQNSVSLSCLADQETKSKLGDVMLDNQEFVQENVKRSEDEVLDLERDEKTTTRSENDQEEMSEIQVNRLQQQVDALQRKVRALSEETQAQAQELAMWRLSSQPASTFTDLLPNTVDNECDTLDQISAVNQSSSDQQLVDELTDSHVSTQSQAQTVSIQTRLWGAQTNQDIITVIRGDELSLCCSSNRLRGRMLFSRLQNSSFPEPKTASLSKKSGIQQDYNQIDQESEKENQEINLEWPDQNKTRRNAELTQTSPQKMIQLSVAKDPHKVSGLHPNKVVESYAGTPEAKMDSSRRSSEINTSAFTTDVHTERKCVSSQTEEHLDSSGAFKVCASTQTEEESVDSPPICSVSVSERVESGDRILLSGSFPIPADPVRLAERIRRNRTQLSAAFDDTEYEPYGLPEVVMKGFADIPSGPSCPYIVRRGLLGTTVLPKSEKKQEEEETD